MNYKIFLLICSLPCLLLAKTKLSSLSLEEKVGQMLIYHIHGRTFSQKHQEFLKKVPLGGLILYSFSNPFNTLDQIQGFTKAAQDFATSHNGKIPLIISVDQEGGMVQRYHQGFSSLPSQKAVANAKSTSLATSLAKANGLELMAAGINMNLSPVSDVTMRENPVIGIRSFGSNPQTVAKFSKAYLKGYKKAGIISCMKHFPGHGDVTADSHEELPVCKKSYQELLKSDLIPFSKNLDFADSVMTAHVLYPDLDPVNPATFSKTILHDLLRVKLNYRGLIISDSLAMNGSLTNFKTIEDMAISAINAGCDMLILGGGKLLSKDLEFEFSENNIKKVHKKLCEAVQNGIIPLSKIDSSVKRILKLKNNFQLAKHSSHSIDRQSHQAITMEIAQKSMQILKGKKNPHKKNHLIAPSLLEKVVLNSKLMKSHPSITFFNDIDPKDDTIATLLSDLPKNQPLVFISYKLWKFPKQKQLLEELHKHHNVTLVVAGDEPDPHTLSPFCETLIVTENPTRDSFDLMTEFF